MKRIKSNPWEGILWSSKKRCINGPDIFWGIDDSGLYCLRFENVELGTLNFNNIELSQINIILNNLDNGLFTIIIKLLDPQKYELFYFLSSDLINHLSTDLSISAPKLKKRLQFWIDLWKKKSNQEMTLIAQMNLFSELIVLFELIVPIKGLEFAVLAWRGPEKDKQDFDLSDYLIEVKSYLSTSKKILKISSAEQLTVRNQPIKLVSLQLSQNPNHGISIPDLLNSYKNELEELPSEIFGLFYTKLFELGFSQENDATIKFNVISTSCYNVEKEFPVINAKFIPEGIENVEYWIKIDSLEKYLLDTKDLVK